MSEKESMKVEEQIQITQQSQGRKPRMANLEMLRCIAMMMVVVLHYLSKGKLLDVSAEEGFSSTVLTAWLIESFCIVAVNVYMMISGYVLCTSHFKLSRLLCLWIQLLTYSIGIGLMAAFLGILPAEEWNTHYLLTLLFPISMDHYWFLTAYIYLYLLLPIVGCALRYMGKKQMQVVLGFLFLVFCVVKSILPFRLEMDAKGYDCIWYLCVFLLAAYVRKFGLVFFGKKWRCFILYFVCVLGAFIEIVCLHKVYFATGSMSFILNIAWEYNHIFTLGAALGLFLMFLNINLPERLVKWVNFVSAYTLGVYLLHENIGIRYAWQGWFGAEPGCSVGKLLMGTISAAFVVFFVGIIVDWIRASLMKVLHKLLMNLRCYRLLQLRIKIVDEMFSN